MASFAAYRDQYHSAWASLQIRPEKVTEARKQARKLASGKDIYKQIESRTGVPWWFIGLCHYREASFNFKAYLGNGQLLDRVTTIVPKGRGPFTGPNAFVDGAVDALRLEHFVGAQDWSIEWVCYRLEGFNGYGYHGHGVNSPYLWGGSTAYGPPESRGGKYVSDGVFDAATIDTQLGTAVILKALLELDDTIVVGQSPAEAAGRQREPDEEAADNILWVQRSLNRLGTDPRLDEDGKNGRNTMGAVSKFQSAHGLNDTGLADAATIAAIEKALRPAPPPTPIVSPPPVLPPASIDPGVIHSRLDDLANQIARVSQQLSAAAPAGVQQPPPGSIGPTSLEAIVAAVQHVLARSPQSQPQIGNQIAQLGGDVPHIVEALNTALQASGGQRPLGQVNGALGNTLGQLLDGKKTAIGVIGAAATEILSHVPASTGLGKVVAELTPAFGLSPYTMPIFLAIAAWGALGKFEKWDQATPSTAPTTRPPTS